jgi:hypothetical protein
MRPPKENEKKGISESNLLMLLENLLSTNGQIVVLKLPGFTFFISHSRVTIPEKVPSPHKQDVDQASFVVVGLRDHPISARSPCLREAGPSALSLGRQEG